MYLGDFREDGDIFFKFSTRAYATGIPTTLAGTPVLSVYKDEGGAATEKTTAETYFDLDVDHDSIAGWHNVRLDLSGDAYFATGADYSIVITTGTAVVLWGSNNTVVGNSFNGRNIGGNGFTLSASTGAIDDNVIRNNIIIDFTNQAVNFTFGDGDSNTITHNLTNKSSITGGSEVRCTNCTINNNIVNSDPGWVGPALDSFDDFRLGSASPAINAGVTLASAHDTGLDPADTTWPPSLLQQVTLWDIGAFLFSGVIIEPPPPADPEATLNGGGTEAEIRAGGQTLVATLTADTWVAEGATFNAERQTIINALTSAQSELLGWNNEVRDKMDVSEVVRTDDITLTITLLARPAYDITSLEVIQFVAPATALVISTISVVATPSITIVTVPDVPGNELSMVLEGVITSIIDASSFLASSTLAIQVGDAVTGSLCYTTTAADRDTSSEWGDYRFSSSPDSMSLAIEGNVWQPTTRFSMQTLIRNGSVGDMFTVSLRGIDMPTDLSSSENPNHSFMQFSLLDTDASVFTDDTLPASGLTLSDFEHGTVEIVVTHNPTTGAYYRILVETIQTLVEP